MADWIRELVKIALTEHKDNVDAVADTVDSYLFVTRQVCKIKAEIGDEIESHRAKMKRLENELAEARKSCPCPSAALVYHGDSSDNNYRYHECRICGKTH